MGTARKPGRPPDPQAAEKLKRAALKLVRAEGYAQVSIAQIIKQAGVSRQTLYNRWTGKAGLVMEAFSDMARVEVPMPELRDGSREAYRETLTDFLASIFDHLAADGDTLRNLIGAAQEDAEFRQVFWTDFVAPREEMVLALLLRARDANLIRTEPETLSAMIHGAFWYWLLNGQPLGRAQAEALARTALP